MFVLSEGLWDSGGLPKPMYCPQNVCKEEREGERERRRGGGESGNDRQGRYREREKVREAHYPQSVCVSVCV